MKRLVTKSDTLFNVPADRPLMHSQILALKCFYNMSWMEESVLPSNVLEVSMVLLTSLHPLEHSYSKVAAFVLQILLAIFNNGRALPRPLLYFAAMAGCLGIAKYQFFLDMLLIYKGIKKLHRVSATGEEFFASIVFMTLAWILIPIAMLYSLVLGYEIAFSIAYSGRNPYRVYYLISAVLLMCFYSGDIEEDCIWHPVECLSGTYPHLKSNITLYQKQVSGVIVFGV